MTTYDNSCHKIFYDLIFYQYAQNLKTMNIFRANPWNLENVDYMNCQKVS